MCRSAAVGSSGHSPLKHLSPAVMLQDLICRPAARAEAVPEALAAAQDCAQALVNLTQLCTAGIVCSDHLPVACHEACTGDSGAAPDRLAHVLHHRLTSCVQPTLQRRPLTCLTLQQHVNIAGSRRVGACAINAWFQPALFPAGCHMSLVVSG